MTPTRGTTRTSVGALLLEAARQNPDGVALAGNAGILTYRELVAAASTLAMELERTRTDESSPVAIAAHRRIEAVVAICACVLAGRPYLPVDPDYPLGRLVHCLSDGAVQLLVGPDEAPSDELARAAALRGAAFLGWDGAIRSGIASGAQVAPPTPDRTGSEAIAYVLYTSGSTGKPKGVEVTDANLLASTVARGRFYGDLETHRSVLVPSMAFDSSAALIFGALCFGGSLIVPDAAAIEDTGALADVVSGFHVTQLLCVPSYYRALLAEREATMRLASLRRVIVAGEACPPGLVRVHMTILPGVELVNEYGPTEATVWASAHRCSVEDSEARRVAIGLPIEGVEIIALDANGEVVPDGLPGEIHIKGPTVARGYRNDPDLTAIRFIPDPRDGRAVNDRVYATGDVGRVNSHGEFEFLGRVDRQVKVNGVRVELDDVESVIGGIDGVAEVAVLGPPLSGSGLVAFVVAADGAELTRDGILTAASHVLPRVMVPTDVRLLEELPRLPNGKVARDALRSLATRPVAGERVEPDGDMEKRLVSLWSLVLGHSRFGVTDDFFLIGGESIKVVMLRTKARKAGVLFTVQDVFEARTVRNLAQRAQRYADSGDAPDAAPSAEAMASP